MKNVHSVTAFGRMQLLTYHRNVVRLVDLLFYMQRSHFDDERSPFIPKYLPLNFDIYGCFNKIKIFMVSLGALTIHLR